MAGRGVRALGFGVVALSALALAGCGDDGETPGGSGTTTTDTGGPSGGLGAQFAGALCGKMYECCDQSELEESFGGGFIEDYAGCRIAYRTIWEGALEPQYDESVAAGRLEFNKESFASCMQALEGLSCAEYTGGAADILECEDAFTPKVQVGGACTISQECVTGRCLIASSEDEGTCVDPATLSGAGGPCDTDDECAEGLYCDFSTCAALQPDGAPCSANEECESTCVGEDSGAGQCGLGCDGGGPGVGEPDLALEALGGPAVLAACGKVFACCTASEVTEELDLFDNPRECRTLQAVFTGLFTLPLLHNLAEQGTVEVDAAAWSACVAGYEAMSCADHASSPDLDCSEAFTPKVADNGACVQSVECVSGYCDKASPSTTDPGVCRQPPGAGDPCTSACAEGLICSGGACQAARALGESCVSDSECAEGSCAGATGSQVCALICDGA